jgi:outer membrane protein assembly factor BamB
LTPREAPASKPATAPAEDWPQYRGPHRNGTSNEKLNPAWPPRLLWTSGPLDKGYSQIVVKDGRAYTLGGDPVVKLYCFDAVTGKKLWTKEVNGGGHKHGKEYGTLATPAIDGDEIFVQHGNGKLFCHDRITGAVKWSAGGSSGAWEGVSPSPLIEGDRIIVSGKVLSRTTQKTFFDIPRCAHTSPITMTVNGRHVIVSGGLSDAGDGTKLCSIGGGRGNAPGRHNTAEYVVFGGDKIFEPNLTGVVQLNATATAVTTVWKVPEMDKGENPRTPVIWGDLVFVAGKCMDLKTGKVLWSGCGAGSSLAADGKVLLYSGKNIRMVNASPTLKEVGTPLVLPGGNDWVAPSLSHGRLYVRAGNQIACYAVGPEAASQVSATAPATAPAGPDRPGASARL